MDIGTLIFRLLPVLGALAFATFIEVVVPLRSQSRRLNGRLVTNLWLLAITLALGMLLNFTLALGAAYIGASGMGLLQLIGVGAVLWLPFRGLDFPATAADAIPDAAGESNDRRSQA